MTPAPYLPSRCLSALLLCEDDAIAHRDRVRRMRRRASPRPVRTSRPGSGCMRGDEPISYPFVYSIGTLIGAVVTILHSSLRAAAQRGRNRLSERTLRSLHLKEESRPAGV